MTQLIITPQKIHQRVRYDRFGKVVWRYSLLVLTQRFFGNYPGKRPQTALQRNMKKRYIPV